MFNDSDQLNVFKIFRILRILRPLKLIKRYEGLRISLDDLVSSFMSIINILMISFFFFVIFGTMGVNIFKGLYTYCEMSKIKNLNGFD